MNRFYLDLSEGALLYCSTPQRVSLKFNWLTQYKSIKLSARSRAVHNFTPGARRNLDVTEFYGVLPESVMSVQVTTYAKFMDLHRVFVFLNCT